MTLVFASKCFTYEHYLSHNYCTTYHNYAKLRVSKNTF
jgi:hypothetical protein